MPSSTSNMALKVAVILCVSASAAAVTATVAFVSLVRHIASSVGTAEPSDQMLQEETPTVHCALIRHLPQLERKLAWRSLGATMPSPIHTCKLPVPSTLTDGKVSGVMLEILVKREDLLSPLYGGNKVRTLQHQLAVCEARRDRGEIQFDRLVSLGSAGSNQVVATAFHARALGWNGTNNKTINPCWFGDDKPDLDNSLNMLSVLSILPSDKTNNGFLYNWGQPTGLFKKLSALQGAYKQNDFVPMMPGGNCPTGVLGQVGAMLELAEQIQAGASPDPDQIYVPIGSGCTVSGLIIGVVLARHLGLKAFTNESFNIVGCNVHQSIAKGDRFFGLHTNRFLGFMPLTITHSIKSTCKVLKDELGGPDLTADALHFMRRNLILKADAGVVGVYGGHSEKSRLVAQWYDEQGNMVDADGRPAKNLWVCGHFVAKAFQPLVEDLEAAIETQKDTGRAKTMPCYMLWMTKSAVQPRGTEDEWSKLLNENDAVLKWANEGQAESPKFRPGKVSTKDGTADDYRSIMTEIL